MTVESAVDAIEQATAADMHAMARQVMRELGKGAMVLQHPPSGLSIPGQPDPRDQRIALLSVHVAALTSCLNMVMVALAKESEVKQLPRAERRRRMN